MQTLRKLSSVFLAALFLCLFLAATPADAQQKPGVPVNLTVPDTILVLQGWAAPNALVTFRNGSSVVSTVTAAADGYFTKQLSAQQPGIKKITAQFKDIRTISSAVSSGSVSLQPQSTSTIDFIVSPTLTRRSPAVIQKSSLVQLSGYTSANAAVEIVLNGVFRDTVTSDSQGYYEYLLETENIAVGKYSVLTRSTSANFVGASDDSERVRFSVVDDEIGPSISRPDIVVSPNQLPPPIPQSPDDGAVIEGDSTTLSGESVPNAQIVFYENGVRAGSVFADENGFWSIEYTATSSPVVLSFEACIDGFCSVLSNSITLIFTFPKSLILEPVCEVVFKLEQYKFSNQSVDTATELNVLLTNGDGVILVDWGDGTNQQKFDHSAETPSAIRHFYKSAGRYNGKITFTQGDCSFDRYFSVDTITSNRISNNFWLLIVVIVLLTPVSYIANERGRKYKP